MTNKRVLSGVQPTGNLHLGNYLGAIRNWVEGQTQYDNFFCVVDLHALTAQHDPKTLADDSYKIAALYLACGIEPEHSTIFIQSQVLAHAQLCWLLNCVTSLNWLERMIQFKEKALKQGENVSIGLLDYPVLMAADILLYQADLVPVGEDQKQHLELCRDIAIKFNNTYAKKKRVFKVPEPLIPKVGARIMSLGDGTSKMSKSDPAEGNRINLLDTPETIRNKVKRCKTDSFEGIEFDNPERPESHNLLSIYQLCSGKTREEAEAECGKMRWSEFKPTLAEAVVNKLTPVREKYNEIMADRAYLERLLDEGKEKAAAVANQTLDAAQEALGLVPRVRS